MLFLIDTLFMHQAWDNTFFSGTYGRPLPYRPVPLVRGEVDNC